MSSALGIVPSGLNHAWRRESFFLRVDMAPLKIEEVAKVVVRKQLAIPSLIPSVVVKKQDVSRKSLIAKIERGEAFVVSL